MNRYDFEPGIYRVTTSRLNVRGTPDSSHQGNLVGIQLTIGKSFPVYRVISDKKGWVWGVITDDSASQEHYVCLWNLNTIFATLESRFPSKPISPIGIEVRLANLEKWARDQGYTG